MKSFSMGGGGHYDYPKHVWSPAGGWMWERAPRAWKRNTGKIFVLLVHLTYFLGLLFRKSQIVSSFSLRRSCCDSRRLLSQHIQRFAITRSSPFLLSSLMKFPSFLHCSIGRILPCAGYHPCYGQNKRCVSISHCAIAL